MNVKDIPKISVYIAASIDGYIARSNGELDWLERVHVADEDYGYQQFLANIDALILGRKTYEIISQFEQWPYVGKRVIVVSSTLTSVNKGAEIFHGDPTELVLKLHSEGIKHIWVDGGTTISKFLNSGLIDRIMLSIIPVILGSGIPLFNMVTKEFWTHLISSKSYTNGVVQLNYKIIRN